MRLLTFRKNYSDHVGVRAGDNVVPVSDIAPELPADLRQLLAVNGMPQVARALEAVNAEGIPAADIMIRRTLEQCDGPIHAGGD